MRLVSIEWRDAYGGTTGWTHLEDIAADDLVYRSVRWLLHDRDDYKAIVPHLVEPREDRGLPNRVAAICAFQLAW
jgi:hypothetical protein